MNLNNLRLQMIYEMIPVCITFADIGTDHAFLPIHLLENEKCVKAIASDVREGPLKVALKNIKKHGLVDKVDIRMGSGLETIEMDECQAIALAGMGGSLIVELLTESIEKARSIPNIVLQPNTEQDKVRKFLVQNNFKIIDENAILDSNHVYLAILCKYEPMHFEEYSDVEYHTGKILCHKETQGANDYYMNMESLTKKIIRGLRKSKSEHSKIKLEEQKRILRWIEENVKSK